MCKISKLDMSYDADEYTSINLYFQDSLILSYKNNTIKN